MKRAWVSSNTVFTFITWPWIPVCWNASSWNVSFLHIKNFHMAFSILHECLDRVKHLSFEQFLNFEKSLIDLFLIGQFVFSLKPFFVNSRKKCKNWLKIRPSSFANCSIRQFIDKSLKFLNPQKFVFFWWTNESNSLIFSIQKNNDTKYVVLLLIFIIVHFL